MQELIKKIEIWGYDRNLQIANPLIQTTKTLEEVIELQQAIINYEDEEHIKGMKELLGESLDRCVLYSYRCAVFSANHPEISKKELLWWHFMDSSDSFSK